MLRPVSVVGLRIASELGEALLRVAVAIVVAPSACSCSSARPTRRPAALLALPAALLGCTLSMTAQHAFGGIAFWLLDARATWFLWSKLVFLLGGLLIPLELLPPGVANVAKVLPWAAMAYVPGRLASGDLDPLADRRPAGVAGGGGSPRGRRVRARRAAPAGGRRVRIARVFRLAVADALANRRSFYVQVIAMAINDVTWVIFWAPVLQRRRQRAGLGRPTTCCCCSRSC